MAENLSTVGPFVLNSLSEFVNKYSTKDDTNRRKIVMKSDAVIY